jgi:hypothetical protein
MVAWRSLKRMWSVHIENDRPNRHVPRARVDSKALLEATSIRVGVPLCLALQPRVALLHHVPLHVLFVRRQSCLREVITQLLDISPRGYTTGITAVSRGPRCPLLAPARLLPSARLVVSRITSAGMLGKPVCNFGADHR